MDRAASLDDVAGVRTGPTVIDANFYPRGDVLRLPKENHGILELSAAFTLYDLPYHIVGAQYVDHAGDRL